MVSSSCSTTLDHIRPRLHVQPVCKAVKRVVLARVCEVEDILRDDVDAADACAGRLQLGEARKALGRRLCLDRRERRGERRERGAQENPN